jgi:hypothetical protein
MSKEQFDKAKLGAASLGISGIMQTHANIFDASGVAFFQSSYNPAVWEPTAHYDKHRHVGAPHLQRVCSLKGLTPHQKKVLCDALWGAMFFGGINSFELTIFCWVASLATLQVELGILCSMGATAIISAVLTAIMMLQITLGCS